MSYITRDDILPHIPMVILIDALDDDHDGVEDTNLLDTILAECSVEVDALVGSRYVTPFSNLTLYPNGIPPAVTRASHAFALEAIYQRRQVPEDKNPWSKEASEWRDHLRMVGRGERQLDASLDPGIIAAAGGDPYVPGRVPVPATTGPNLF